VRGALLLFGAAVALTLAMAAPVLQAPAERLFGREIVGRHHDAYTMVRQFEQPSRQPFSQPATDLVGVALARRLGGVRAYNLLVLASFPLAALFAYLLARHLALPGWAAGLAALVFAFSPTHVAHAAYHPHVAQIQWIPLYLLALARCLDRWTPGRAALLLLAGGLLTLSNFYGGLFGALLTPVVVLAYRPPTPPAEQRPARWATSLTLIGGGLAGWLYLRLTAGRIAGLAERFAFPASDIGRYAARWYSYLVPPVEHPLAGDRLWAFWAERRIADGLLEQQLTLGSALLVLAALAIAGWRRRPDETPGSRNVPFLAVLALAAFLGSLAPAPAAGPWPAPALAAMLHPLLPMFRAYARLGVFTQLSVALLAAIAAAALARRGRRPRLLAGALLLAAAIELTPFPPWRWHALLPTRAHRWMADQPAPWRLLDCVEAPPSVARSIAQLLPQPASVLSAGLADCAEPHLPGKLAARGYSHLLLRSASAEERWFGERGLPDGLAEERRFADSRVLRVTAAPDAVYVDLWRGFSWREYAGERSFRWLGPSGAWELVNRETETVELRLRLELWSLGSARDLEVTLDGERLASLAVGTEPGWHLLPPLSLAPGRHRLDWRPAGPAVIPDELFGNGDRRRLTVAVGEWRWPAAPADGSSASTRASR
jgi:hypothetical protein